MHETPLVSIVIPAFNQGQFLEEAIASCLNQTWQNLEVVIVDDGSTDETPKVLKKMAAADSRVRFFHQENQGFAVAMNRAIKESKGAFIAHLDSDDIMEKEKIEKQMAFLKQFPDFDLVHTAVTIIDENGEPQMVFRGEDVPPENFLAKMLDRSIMGNPTTLLGKRACWIEVPFLEKYKRSVDYDRVLRLAMRYRFKYLDEPLTCWRRHESNLTNDLTPYRKEQLEILRALGKEKIFQAVESSSLSDEEKQLIKGRILYNIEEYKSAIDELKGLICPQAHFTLGNAFFKLGEVEKAIVEYHACLAKAPSDAACHNNLGVCLSTLAKKHFSQALELKPGYLDAESNAQFKDFRLTERQLRDQLIPYQF